MIEVKELYEQGLSIRQIANKLNIKKGMVNKYLKEYQVKTRTKSESIAIRCKNSPRDKSTYAMGPRKLKEGPITFSLIGNQWEIKKVDLRSDRKNVECLFVNGKRANKTDKVGFICETTGKYIEKTVGNFLLNPVLKSRNVCIGEANKGKKVSEEHKKQISEKNSGEKITTYFDFICPICGNTYKWRDTAKNRKKKTCSKECNIVHWALWSYYEIGENNLEKTFREEIERQGYKVEIQKLIGYYPVDCYLPEIDIILQIDGTYWHAKPNLYKEDQLNDIQKNKIMSDKRFASYCKNHNLKYARVWEDDFYANPEKEVKEAIKKALRREP